jgi:hypothetical protein
MLLKNGKTTPMCLKRLLDDDVNSPVVNTLGSLNSPVIIHRGFHFLVYLKQASEKVYKKTFW